MSNYGDTPDETPQDPYGQQPPQGPPGEPSYGQQPPQGPPGEPNYGQPAGAPAGQPAGQSPYGQAPGGNAPFSVGTAFSYGWNKFKDNLGPILIAFLALVVASVAVQAVGFVVTGVERSFLTAVLLNAVGSFVQLLFLAVIVKATLDLTKGTPISLGSITDGIDWAQVAIAALIIAVASAIGTQLLILPGLAVWFLTAFTLYFIIDKGLPAIEAIKASASFVVANIGTLIIFFLASAAACIVGALACLVGLFVAVPVVLIAQAYAYRTLQGEQVAA